MPWAPALLNVRITHFVCIESTHEFEWGTNNVFLFPLIGTTAQQPLQHPRLLPEEAQQWLTGGGTNRLERSGGLDSSPPRLIDTSLSSPRKPRPLPSIHEDNASGMDCGPFFHCPQTHTQHAHTFPTNQPNSGLSDGAGPGALASVIGDWLTWLSQWGAIVSYGNVLQSWGQEPYEHTHTYM